MVRVRVRGSWGEGGEGSRADWGGVGVLEGELREVSLSIMFE